MEILFIRFWTAMVFLSIVWYASLLLYVGVKGGREIVEMMHNLSKIADDNRGDPEP